MSGYLVGLVFLVGPIERDQRNVLAAIADAADDHTGYGWPGIKTLANKTLFSERYVIDAIKALAKDRWMTVEPRAVKGRYTAYTIDVDKLEALRRAQREMEKELKRSTVNVAHETYLADLRKLHVEHLQSTTPVVPQPHELEQPQTATSMRPLPSSPGAKGFAAALHVVQEIGMPASAGDLPVVAQAVHFCMRDKGTEEHAVAFLIGRAREDQKSGELINIFWFKNQRYNQQPAAEGEPHGTGQGHRGTTRPSATKDRIDGTRRKLVAALEQRGILDFSSGVRGSGEAISKPGRGGIDGRLSGGLRSSGVEVLPPERN